MKNIRTIAIVVILAGAAYWLLSGLRILPSLSNIFEPKPVVIDETPILIKQIRSIGQLITYTSFDEVVVDSVAATRGSAFVRSFNSLSPFALLPSADKQIVLIARGKVLAGTDLMTLTGSSIKISNDTVSLWLPSAKILDAIVNPGDFETFVEKGNWSSQEVTQVKIRARQKMINRALNQHILEKAGEKSRAVMSGFLSNLGYKKVLVF